MGTPRRVASFALAYWAGIFALGFVLGSVRVLWLASRIGALIAVLAELPLMLAASWLWARRLARRHPLASRGEALGAGALAFALLLASEAALGRFGFGQDLCAWFAALWRLPGAVGLAGQLAFAALPALAWRPVRSPG